MLLQRKVRRRLIIAASVGTVLAASLAGGYLLLQHRKDVAAQTSYKHGLAELDQKDFDSALHSIGRYVQRYPNDMKALSKYAMLREKVPLPNFRHLADAIKVYVRVISQEPDNIAASHELIRLYQMTGYDTELLALADRVLARNPNDLDALYGKAVASFRLSRGSQRDEALATALRYIEQAPDDIKGYLLSINIMQASEQGRARVPSWINELAEKQGENQRTLFLKSLAAAFGGNTSAARELARKAIEAQATDEETVRILASHCDRLELYGETVSLLEKFAASTNSEQALLQLARRRYVAGDYRKVLDISAPSVLSIDFLRAICAAEIGDSTLSAEAIRKLQTHGDSEVAKVLQAFAETQGNSESDASELFVTARAAMNADPSNLVAQLCVADSLRALGEIDSAVALYKRLILSEPAWSKPFARLSATASANGQYSDGRILAQKAIDRNANDFEGQLLLANCLSKQLSLADASGLDNVLQALDKAEELSNDKPKMKGSTLPIRISAFSAVGRRGDAEAVVRQLISKPSPVSQQVTMEVLYACSALGSELEKEVAEYCERQYGLSPELAAYRAQRLIENGDKVAAVELVAQGLASAKPQDQLEWRVLQAKILDETGDARALEAWKTLTESFAQNVRVQWHALVSRSARSDHAFEGRLIERIGEQAELRGTNWRIARAQWLMRENNNQKTAEAAVILSDLVKAQPQLSTARLLLAECMNRLNQQTAASEQLIAASDSNPQAADLALSAADLLIKRQEVRRALTYLNRAANAASASIEQRVTAAGAVASLGQPTDALKALQRAIPDLPGAARQNQPLALLLARLYVIADQRDRVEELCPILAEQGTADSLSFLANYYASTGRVTEGQAAIARLGASNASEAQKALISAQYELRFGDKQKALGLLKAATTQNREDPALWRQLIRATAGAGTLDEALQHARSAAAALPDDKSIAAFIELAPIAQDILKRWPEATEIAVDSMEDSTLLETARSALTGLAEIEKNSKTRAEVAGKLGKMIIQIDRLPGLQKAAARAYLESNQPAEAASIASQAASKFPQDRTLAEQATIAYSLAGRWSEAAAAALEWRRRSDSDTFGADIYLASASARMGDINQATSSLAPYLANSSATQQRQAAAILLAGIKISTNQIVDAEALLRPQLAEGEAWRAGWMQLAAAQIPDLETARRWLREVDGLVAAASASEHANLINSWMSIAERGGNRADVAAARAVAERLAAIPNVPTEYLTVVAQIREADGDRHNAQELYEKVLAANPKDAVACNNMAMILMSTGGDLAAAEQYAATATGIQGHPSRVDFLDTLSQVQAARQKKEQAIQSVDAALAIDSSRPEMLLRRIQWLVDLSRTEDARTSLQKFEEMKSSLRELTQEEQRHLGELRLKVPS
jgi:predicted Zn-dependent protease